MRSNTTNSINSVICKLFGSVNVMVRGFESLLLQRHLPIDLERTGGETAIAYWLLANRLARFVPKGTGLPGHYLQFGKPATVPCSAARAGTQNVHARQRLSRIG